MRVEDRIAVITGGARGIGFGIAEKLALEGANIAIVDIISDPGVQAVEAIRKMGRRAEYYYCDVRDSTQVKATVDAVVADFGTFDVLVNVAGVNSHVLIVDMEDEEWDRVIGVNLKGTFLCTREAARYWIKAKRGGKIINITSNRAEMGRAEIAHYCASKGGVKMLTRASAVELIEHGIVVNAIGPGPIGGTGIGAGQNIQATSAGMIPVGHMGSPSDIGWAAVYLASDESEYLLGTTIQVDGGRTITNG